MPKKSARAEMIELDGKHAVLQAPEEQKTDICRWYRKYRNPD